MLFQFLSTKDKYLALDSEWLENFVTKKLTALHYFYYERIRSGANVSTIVCL